MAEKNGLMENNTLPNGLAPPTACIKLVRPNMAPKNAPTEGPVVIAPMITGMVRNVISKGPTFKYPMGVKDRTKITAVKSAVRVNTEIFKFFIFVFLSFCILLVL